MRTQFVLGEGTERLRVTVDMKAEYSDLWPSPQLLSEIYGTSDVVH